MKPGGARGRDGNGLERRGPGRSVRQNHVSSGTKWESTVGYPRAVRAGSTVHVAGTTATDDDGNVVGAARGETSGDIRPATTMVEVSRLVDPAMLVEVEAVAVVAG